MGLFKRQSEENVLDVREAVAVEPPAPPRRKFGSPGRCPACGGRGFLDHIDVIDRVQYEHCTECRTKWITSEAELLQEA